MVPSTWSRYGGDHGQAIHGLGSVIRSVSFLWTPRRGYLPKNKEEKKEQESNAHWPPRDAHNVGLFPIFSAVKMYKTEFFPVSNRLTRGPSALSSEKQRARTKYERGGQATGRREGTGSVGAKKADYNHIVDVYRHGSCR